MFRRPGKPVKKKSVTQRREKIPKPKKAKSQEISKHHQQTYYYQTHEKEQFHKHNEVKMEDKIIKTESSKLSTTYDAKFLHFTENKTNSWKIVLAFE